MGAAREQNRSVMPVGAGSAASHTYCAWYRRLAEGMKRKRDCRPGERRGTGIDCDDDRVFDCAPAHTLENISHSGPLPGPHPRIRQSAFRILLTAGLLLLAGCRQGMYDQPKFLPLQENGMYPDRASSRPLPPGTIATGEAAAPQSGRVNGVLIENVPLPLTPELLAHGRQRFNIFCAPCHDQLGHGTGMIVLRGFRNPPSYHIPRLVNAPDGYFFEVMTEGYGTMYAYADRVAPRDRWAIVAYIRALEYSQHAALADVPPAERPKLEGGVTP